MNRALSLAREDEDETDTKLDELIAQVNLLVCKQRERVRNALLCTSSDRHWRSHGGALGHVPPPRSLLSYSK